MPRYFYRFGIQYKELFSPPPFFHMATAHRDGLLALALKLLACGVGYLSHESLIKVLGHVAVSSPLRLGIEDYTIAI